MIVSISLPTLDVVSAQLSAERDEAALLGADLVQDVRQIRSQPAPRSSSACAW
jgi:hypothetical protein